MQRKSTVGSRPLSRRPKLNLDTEKTYELMRESEEIRAEIQATSKPDAASTEMHRKEDPTPNPPTDSQKSILPRPEPRRTSSGRDIFGCADTVNDLVREAEQKKQKEEAQRKEKEEAEKSQREKEEAERREREEIERKAKEKAEAERREREERERRAREETERRQREEAQRKEREEAERRQREETEKIAREKAEIEKRQREERERRQRERQEKERRDEERRRQREEEQKREEAKRRETRPMAFFVDSSFSCSARPEKSAEACEREFEGRRAEESEIKAQYLSRLKSRGQPGACIPSWSSSFRNSDAYKAQFVSYPIQL